MTSEILALVPAFHEAAADAASCGTGFASVANLVEVTQLPEASVLAALKELEHTGDVIHSGGVYYRPLSNARGVSRWG